MQRLQQDTIISDRFAIESLLGEGGMGLVYRARQLDLNRPIAIKLIRPDHLDSKSIQRFIREGQYLSRLSNHNVAKVYACGIHEKHPYLAMELLDGQTLRGLLTEQQRLGWRLTFRIVDQICLALVEMHKIGILHRDLKPENIFVLGDPAKPLIKVADFGLAQLEGDKKLTATGLVVGTPLYMSPEQAQNAKLTPAADIYAIGCVMYECLFGKTPYNGDLIEVLYAHVTRPVPLKAPASSSDATSAVLRILKTMLQKEPSARPSPERLHWELSQVLSTSQPDGLIDVRYSHCGPETKLLNTSSIAKTLVISMGIVSIATMGAYQWRLQTEKRTDLNLELSPNDARSIDSFLRRTESLDPAKRIVLLARESELDVDDSDKILHADRAVRTSIQHKIYSISAFKAAADLTLELEQWNFCREALRKGEPFLSVPCPSEAKGYKTAIFSKMIESAIATNDIEAAERYLRQQTTTEPVLHDDSVMMASGQIALAKHDTKKAIQEFQSVTEENQTKRLELARAYAMENQWDKADSEFAKYKSDLNKPTVPQPIEAVLAAHHGDWPKAEQSISQMLLSLQARPERYYQYHASDTTWFTRLAGEGGQTKLANFTNKVFSSIKYRPKPLDQSVPIDDNDPENKPQSD